MFIRFAVIATTVCLGFSSILSAAPPDGKGPKSSASYTIHALDSRDGAAEAISDTGELAGWVNTQVGSRQPFLWQVTDEADGTVVTTYPLSLEGTGAPRGYATDLSTWICGNAEFDDPNHVVDALVWSGPTAIPLLLPAGEGFIGNTVAMGTSLPGMVVGFRFTFENGAPTFDHTALVWGIPLVGDPVGPLVLGRGVARRVSNTGLIVGENWSGTATPPAAEAAWWQVSWDGETLALVDSGAMLNSPSSPSIGLGVNNNSWMCGQQNGEAFVLDENSNLKPLASLVDDETYYTRNDIARAMNDLEQPEIIGGVSVIDRQTYAINRRPVLWKGATVIDLISAVGADGTKIPRSSPAYPGPDVLPSEVFSINNSSWIGGRGSSSTSGPPVVLIPIQP